ncbi:TPR-like protein [Teratosphaeria nubilosa]|uniref:TPR-like protein n=1 Tax=Teratosphaeria nubilosa TaxID=161662 RepID=A0A6G1L616_9PEZI|nr:TPR-like protein [Teratosphaeria nubilosa]
MSPTSGIAASQLHQLIFYHIDNELLDTANFLAGRLHALEPRNPDSSHLLALTYFRQRRYKAAYDFAQKYGASGRHLGCAYIFAQACLELRRYTEGTAALEKAKSSWAGRLNWKKHSETTRRHLPDAPAVYTLMAKLWRGHGDWQKAGDCYIEAHKANPFTWDAFEGLCRIGADLKIEHMFRPPVDAAGQSSSSSGVPEIYTDEAPSHSYPLAPTANFNQQVFTPSADPFAGEGVTSMLPSMKGKSALGHEFRKPLSEWDTPTANSGALDDVAMGGVQLENEDILPPAAPARRVRPTHESEASNRPRQPASRGHAASSSEALSEDSARRPGVGGQKRTISGAASQASSAVSSDPSAQPRRSNRLFGQTGTTKGTRSTAETTASYAGKLDRTSKPATGARGRTGTTVGRVVSGNRKLMPPNPADKEKEKRAPSRAAERPAVPGVTSAVVQKTHAHPSGSQGPDLQAEQQAMTALLDSLRNLADGHYATSRFDLPKAIATFTGLPSAQRETPWVLAQLGKAYYEANDHGKAEECFARLMKLQPSRVEDMEVYSTTLWHLKKDSALAFLSHSLRDQGFHAPQTWCSVGNAFSLQREHEQAISAFKRATQLDGNFAYAWTLMGHEYIANEEFDAALAAFRKSVAVDRRCYGGWYGLGKSYERLGKLEEAERHYRIAASINPSNATLLVCIGVVLERLRNKNAALANYTKALELAPSSALARFKKARVLMHIRRYDDALAELEILRDQAPDEANVWFLLGKCYKGLGNKAEALRALTSALNLDVKAAPFIKEAMEALDDEDDDSDDD